MTGTSHNTMRAVAQCHQRPQRLLRADDSECFRHFVAGLSEHSIRQHEQQIGVIDHPPRFCGARDRVQRNLGGGSGLGLVRRQCAFIRTRTSLLAAWLNPTRIGASALCLIAHLARQPLAPRLQLVPFSDEPLGLAAHFAGLMSQFEGLMSQSLTLRRQFGCFGIENRPHQRLVCRIVPVRSQGDSLTQDTASFAPRHRSKLRHRE